MAAAYRGPSCSLASPYEWAWAARRPGLMTSLVVSCSGEPAPCHYSPASKPASGAEQTGAPLTQPIRKKQEKRRSLPLPCSLPKRGDGASQLRGPADRAEARREVRQTGPPSAKRYWHCEHAASEPLSQTQTPRRLSSNKSRREKTRTRRGARGDGTDLRRQGVPFPCGRGRSRWEETLATG